MDRERLYIATFLILYVALGDTALRMCTRCECSYKDKYVIIDCNNQQLSETHLHQIQNNPNTTFVNLNFSHNNFSTVPAGLNTHGVKYLDLSVNNIEDLKHLNDFKELVELNLAYNNIEDFRNETLEILSLTLLNMSHCSLKNLRGFENSILNELITLDLSNNEIKVFDKNFFKNMTQLNYLDLSNNFIKKIHILGFTNLQILNVQSNIIGPEIVFPRTLLELNAQNNSIEEIYMNEEFNESRSSLVFLYLNQNKLTNLPNVTFTSLKILDLSRNEFTTIPEVLNNDKCPVLEVLILSENKFTNFEFQAKLRLKSLKLNSVNSIRRLKKDMFKMLENYDNECINISVKDNPELHTVENSTFEDLDICFLDLSNNSLEHFPQLRTKIGDWRNIKNGLNFQRNPLVCDCESQWILDDFINFYYGNFVLENLLSNLKCAEPYYIRDYRLIHWYKWKGSIFCESEGVVISRMSNSIPEDHFGKILLRTSGTMLLSLLICTAFLATLFVVGLVLAKKVALKRTRHNRRF